MHPFTWAAAAASGIAAFFGTAATLAAAHGAQGTDLHTIGAYAGIATILSAIGAGLAKLSPSPVVKPTGDLEPTPGLDVEDGGAELGKASGAAGAAAAAAAKASTPKAGA